jgi:CheY-like chemotaxis protein
VEDSLINQKLAIALLEKWGHRVTVANDGREAVDLSGQQSFDVVLMDVQMPEMDGLDATRAIRQRELTSKSHVPILAMTAHAMKGDRERCLEAGMDDYLMKPIRAEQLFHALERIGMDKPPLIPIAQTDSESSIEKDRVDWDFASQAVNFDDELLCHVVEAFQEECPQLIETMHKSIASADWKLYQRAAHTLKSGMRMFGVSSLANEIERLELTIKSDQFQPDTLAATNSIAQRSRVILQEMSLYMQSPPNNGRLN